MSEGYLSRRHEVDYVSGVERQVRESSSGITRHLHTGIEWLYEARDVMSVHPDEPNSAKMTAERCFAFERGEWKGRTDTTITVRAERDNWKLEGRVKATDNEGVVVDRTWSESIPRDLV